MGKAVEDSDLLKSQLVIDICSISISNAAPAPHCYIHQGLKPSQHIIDWYLLLRVQEDAHIDVIRKQYRKLALQLHPDKNKHPKADIAFKLVSEAYACLSDKVKRKAFDSARRNSFCHECNRIAYKNCNPPTKQATSNTVLQQLREVRDKFREEVRVIEKCLKVNRTSTEESPVFNPSHHLFQDYPHNRTQIYNKPNDFHRFRAGNFHNFENRRGKCESPIFEIRSERTLDHQKPVVLSS